MKQKTAMMELIDEMNKSPLMFSSALTLVDVLKSIKKEKEQIMEAWTSGENNIDFDGLIEGNITFEQYYNETYKQD